MTRHRMLVAVGLIVLVAVVVIWRTTRPAEPSAREQFRSRLSTAPGVEALRWSYSGSDVAVVRLHAHVTPAQVRHLVRIGHGRCCKSVLNDGDARMEIDDHATMRSADLFVALAAEDVPGVVSVPADRIDVLTVRMSGDDLPTTFRATQRLVSAGGSRLDAMLVQTKSQDIAHFAVSGSDLDEQGSRNRLNQLLGIAADPALGVEQVMAASDLAEVQLHAADRAHAAVLWRRATRALRGHGVDRLLVRVGDADVPGRRLMAAFGAPFSSAKASG